MAEKNLNWRRGSFLLNLSGDLISPVIMIIVSPVKAFEPFTCVNEALL